MTSLHIIDTAVLSVTTIATLAASSALENATVLQHAAEYGELRLFLMPFIGSMIVSGGFILLNPEAETRRITIGRSVFALFIGVLMPQVVAAVHPALGGLVTNPAILTLVGGGISGLAYVLSKPFVSGLYKRATPIANRELDRLEQHYSPPKTEN